MKPKLIILIALLAGFAHCDKLFLIKDYLGSTSAMTGPTPQFREYVLIKDDSTFAWGRFGVNSFGMTTLALDGSKGKWAIAGDSLVTVAKKCNSKGLDCKEGVVSYPFLNDSILISGSKKMDIGKDALFVKRVQNAETQGANVDTANTLLLLIVLAGCVAAIIIAKQ